MGNPADIVIFDAHSPQQAIAEISQPVVAFKNGKQTVSWQPPESCGRSECVGRISVAREACADA